MNLTDKVLDALRNAILLESRVASLAGHVGDLAREVRDIDRRLVRLETFAEFDVKPARRPAIEDKR